MVYIKGLKFRGFKSFRRAEASFIKGFVCLAGPNGSGKSNVTDGIRFALGEGSLKALRAKRVSELVNTSSKFAEVTLYIDGERQYEIKRLVSPEGKTLYKINGKRSTRTLVMEELRPLGLEAGSHNIIAQGQVQKIVEMNAKERRQIIDGVAGISEFDAKKAEAISELNAVGQKISDAHIVLSERETTLSELERQKNDALTFLDAQDNSKRAKASLVTTEHAKLSKSFEDTIQKHTKAKEEAEEIEKQLSVLSARNEELQASRKQVVDKLGANSQREAMMQEIESIKVGISSFTATLAEKKKEIMRLESAIKSFFTQKDEMKKSQKAAAALVESLSSQASALSKEILALEKKSGATAQGNEEEMAKKLEFISAKIVSLKEQKAKCESDLSGAEKMLAVRKEERGRLSESTGEEKSDKLSGEISIFRKEVLSYQSQIDAIFEQERETNRRLPELDRKLLSLSDKAATLRASVSPASVNMAIRAVDEMKGEMKGIYGTVSTLVKFEAKYGAALEASAGPRLNYVVVDRMDTAVKAIERLKAQKAGRCTFIPLDSVQPQHDEKGEKPSGCIGSLIEFVDFDSSYTKAMEYVFSGTLLFDTVQSAKKAGIGKLRMVTLDGELIEKSGIISGGAQKGSMLAKASLDKVEAELSDAKAERDSLYKELYSIREEMSSKRKEKADSEVKMRALEIELRSIEERKESGKKAREALSEIDSSISSLEKEITSLGKSLQAFSSDIEKSVLEHEGEKKKLLETQQRGKQRESAEQKKLQELCSRQSAAQAQLEAKREELSRIAASLLEKEKEEKESGRSLGDCGKEIVTLEKSISSSETERKGKEGKLAEVSAASQKLMAKMNELDAQIADIGKQIGKVNVERDRKNREMMDLEVKKQTSETRLSDLKVELDTYSGVPTIDATKAELEALVAKSHAAMDALGANVNLKAPELFEQKKKDIEEIKTRVASLDSEKNAVMRMMDELEAKKRAIFLSTFTAVNDNFKRLFNYVFKGEGTLLLDQPSSPFEGGLQVKVRDEKHEKYLDSMSGGEKSLLALIFIFSIQMHKAAPFYILDEADAALDKENSRKLAELIRKLSSNTQFIVVTHNDTVLSSADVALGVTRTEDGSKIVGVQLTSAVSVAKEKKA